MHSLSLIIPAYNEESRLPGTLQHIAEYCAGTHAVSIVEIIIIDDGSTDRTAEIASQWTGHLPIVIGRLERNMGKGAALRAGVLRASGDFVLLYDADAATPLQELDHLMKELEANRAAIAIGSRVGRNARERVSMQWHRRLIGWTYHLLTMPLIPGIDDAACGCKLFRTDAAKDLFSRQRINRFAYDIEILFLAIRRGYRIVEVPVQWRAVPISKVRIVRDGIEMVFRVLRLYVWWLWGR